LFFFFFSSRRRHTRSTRDWSSDVCSSDLIQKPECPAHPFLSYHLLLDSGFLTHRQSSIVNRQLICDVSFDTGIERVPHGTVFFTREGYRPLDLALLEVCPLDFEMERQAREAAGFRFRAPPFDAGAYGAEAPVHLAQNMDDVDRHASRQRHHQGFHRGASFAAVAIQDKPAAVHRSVETKTSLPLNLRAHACDPHKKNSCTLFTTETRRTRRCTENPLNCGLRIADC